MSWAPIVQGVPGRGPARSARDARGPERPDPLSARDRGRGLQASLDAGGRLRPISRATDALGTTPAGSVLASIAPVGDPPWGVLVERDREPGVRIGGPHGPGHGRLERGVSGRRAAAGLALRPAALEADHPARPFHPRRRAGRVRDQGRGRGHGRDRRPVRELQHDERVDPRRLRKGPESRAREPGALRLLDPGARRGDRRQGPLHARPLRARGALRLGDRQGDGPAARGGRARCGSRRSSTTSARSASTTASSASRPRSPTRSSS